MPYEEVPAFIANLHERDALAAVGNITPSPREVVETALAHVIGDKAEQAYRRSDTLEKRRKLMEAWASYCTASATEKVVPVRKA